MAGNQALWVNSCMLQHIWT